MNESIGITVMNTCYGCQQIEDLCLECTELAEARATYIAYQIVDEGNQIYPSIWSRAGNEPSASDWVASETLQTQSYYIISIVTKKITTGTYINKHGETMQWNENWYHIDETVNKTVREGGWLIRREFAVPTVSLQDGGVHEELWELDDYTQSKREVQCRWCNILTPKLFNDCQSCDKPLESNVR